MRQQSKLIAGMLIGRELSQRNNLTVTLQISTLWIFCMDSDLYLLYAQQIHQYFMIYPSGRFSYKQRLFFKLLDSYELVLIKFLFSSPCFAVITSSSGEVLPVLEDAAPAQKQVTSVALITLDPLLLGQCGLFLTSWTLFLTLISVQ